MKTITPNKRERRAAQLLAHYATCERLAVALGMPAAKVDGKKISVALLKLEHDAHAGSTAYCNGEKTTVCYKTITKVFDFRADENAWDCFSNYINSAVRAVFGGVLIPAFFVNGDPRGYALKIDNEKPEGRALIEAVKMHTDWGGYGILSPEITGDN